MTKTKRTPGPWVQSDMHPKYIFRDAGGVIDIQCPVAVCKLLGDANIIVLAP